MGFAFGSLKCSANIDKLKDSTAWPSQTVDVAITTQPRGLQLPNVKRRPCFKLSNVIIFFVKFKCHQMWVVLLDHKNHRQIN
jgi:hypothetical protein